MICERDYILTVNGISSPVPISFHTPVKQTAGWTCAFEIGWPSGIDRKEATGIDSVQALVIAFQMAAALLYASSYHQHGQLSWKPGRKGYGLPVTRGMRDILVGDDEAFL